MLNSMNEIPTSSIIRMSSLEQKNQNRSLKDSVVRMEEKEGLKNNNKRLANYFKKQGEIEKEIQDLRNQLQAAKDEIDLRYNDYETDFENQLEQRNEELKLARQNLLKQDLDCKKLQQSLLEGEKEQNHLLADVKSLKKKNENLSNEIERFVKKINESKSVRELIEKSINNLHQEIQLIAESSTENLNRIENENLRIVGLQFEIESLSETYLKQEQFYQEKLAEIRKVQIERDDLFEQELKNRFQELQTDFIITSNRDQENKVNEIKKDLQRKNANYLKKLKDDLHKTSSNNKLKECKLDSLQTQIRKQSLKIDEMLQNEDKLCDQIDELNVQVEKARKEKQGLVEEKDRLISELKENLNLKLKENQMAIDIKNQFEDEIRIYGNLLDQQENRVRPTYRYKKKIGRRSK